MELITFLVSVAAIVLAWGIWEWYVDNSRVNIPKNWGYPFFYSFINVIKNKDRIYDFTLDNCMQLGTVYSGRLCMLTPRVVIVADPAAVEHILKTNWENYIKGPFFSALAQDLLGDGIFNTNGENWKRQRKIASHIFTNRELRGMSSVFIKHAEALISKFQRLVATGESIDIQDIFQRCTLDSIGQIAFGINVDSLHKEVPFAEAFNTALFGTDARAFNPLWKWMPWSTSERKMRKAIAVINDFAKDIIDSRKKESLEGKTDLLSRYMAYSTETDDKLSDQFLRDMIMNFMIAGRDTTAQTLTWCFYLLSQNERVEKKLLDEIGKFFSNYQTPTYDSIKQLAYLQAVVDETLRLYPPVPIDPKTAVKADVLPGGFRVEAGWGVEWNQWIMGRHPKYWDCPTEFRPERWFGENGGKPVPQGNQPPFIPFQYGPRVCLGMNFAYQEVKIILIMLLQRFHLRLAPNQRVWYRSAVTISVKDGIKMHIVARRPAPDAAAAAST